MGFKPFDFYKPIMENRNEVMAIRFHGTIKNVCEEMVAMIALTNTEKWLSKYPRLHEILDLKDERILFEYTAKYTAENFLSAMATGKPVPKKEIMDDTAKLMGIIDPKLVSFTTLEVGLPQIASYDFCKKVYLFDKCINPATKDYIEKNYGFFADKLFMGEGTLKELIEADPEITTIITNDVEEVMEVMELYEGEKTTEKLKDKQFFIEFLPSIDESIKPQPGKLFTVKYEEYLNSSKVRFGANVSWIISHYIDLNDPNPGIVTANPFNTDKVKKE